MRCLLIEDDTDLATWLLRALADRGVIADWEEDGVIGLRRALEEAYEALILDLGLPGLDGAALLARLRAAGATVPILVITARDDLAERVALLHAGADDFLSKPFAVEELEARLVALVRRSLGRARGLFTCGSLSYDQAAQRFSLGGQPLLLTPREHSVLRILIQRPGEPQSKTQIMDRLLGSEADLNLEAIEVMIHRLRRKLEAGAPGEGEVRIVTLRGLGYFLEAADAG